MYLIQLIDYKKDKTGFGFFCFSISVFFSFSGSDMSTCKSLFEKSSFPVRAYPKNKTPSEFGSHNRQISIIPIQDRASIDDLPYDIPIEVFLG